MTPAEGRVFAALYAVASARLSSADHVQIQVTSESRGHCGWDRPCGPKCRQIRATLAEAKALLDAQVPARQLQLVEVAS